MQRLCRLKRVNTTTEQARREALIFPLIDQICDRLNYSINIEYTVSVSNWLKGSLDYYISSPSNFLIIEAKQSDLTKGFTQLAVELIALDHWVESDSPILYGAVSSGEIWRFGLYDRAAHHLVEYLPLHPISCHAFKLGISSEQDARTTRLSPLLILRFKCRTAYRRI